MIPSALLKLLEDSLEIKSIPVQIVNYGKLLRSTVIRTKEPRTI